MTGSMTLTRNNILCTLNLGLSDQLDVTGSISIVESGATIQLTNVTGKISNTLTCNASVSPYGWTGTGTLNLFTGAITVNLNTGSGNSTAASDSLGGLTIHYADGTSDAVPNALSSGLTPSSGGGTSGSYGSPILFLNTSITAMNNNGAMIGYLVGDNRPVYWSSPTAASETLKTISGYTSTQAVALNDNGQIVGTGTKGYPNGNVPFYWSGKSATPVQLSFPNSLTTVRATGINNSGQIVGWGAPTNAGNTQFVGLYWSSPTAQPAVVQTLPNYTGAALGAISQSGEILGTCYGTQFPATNSAVWPTPTGQPVALSVLSGLSYSVAIAVNTAGKIAGSSDIQNGTPYPASWTNVSAAATQLGYLHAQSDQGSANSINTSGVIVGNLSGYYGQSSTFFNVAVLWNGTQATDLNTLIPSGNAWSLINAKQINDSGWILGTATQNGLGAMFVIIPK
jgi:uncharacterized membrane protein